MPPPAPPFHPRSSGRLPLAPPPLLPPPPLFVFEGLRRGVHFEWSTAISPLVPLRDATAAEAHGGGDGNAPEGPPRVGKAIGPLQRRQQQWRRMVGETPRWMETTLKPVGHRWTTKPKMKKDHPQWDERRRETSLRQWSVEEAVRGGVGPFPPTHPSSAPFLPSRLLPGWWRLWCRVSTGHLPHSIAALSPRLRLRRGRRHRYRPAAAANGVAALRGEVPP